MNKEEDDAHCCNYYRGCIRGRGVGGGGGGIDRFVIDSSNKTDKNILYLLLFVPVPSSLFCLNNILFPLLCLLRCHTFIHIDIQSILFHNASTPIVIVVKNRNICCLRIYFVACDASPPLPLSSSSSISISNVPVVMNILCQYYSPLITTPELVCNYQIIPHLYRLCCNLPASQFWSS